MRIITFAYPIRYTRGALAPKQSLGYGTGGSSAWAEADGAAPAVGYKPILVTAKRRTGFSYYSVRTKSTARLNENTRLSMAVFGACSAYVKAIKDTPAAIAALSSIYTASKSKLTLREWLFAGLSPMLRDKAESATFAADQNTYIIYNVWQYAGTPNIQLPPAIVSKFNAQLG